MSAIIRRILIAKEKDIKQSFAKLLVCIYLCICVKYVSKMSCGVRMNEMLTGSSKINSKLLYIPYDNG